MSIMTTIQTHDAIECPPVKLKGCTFWRSEWMKQSNGNELRTTARVMGCGWGDVGYRFDEFRTPAGERLGKPEWFLCWRNFDAPAWLTMIADYREVK